MYLKVMLVVAIILLANPGNSETPPSNHTYSNTRPVLKLPSHGGQNGTPFDDTRYIQGAEILKIHSMGIGSLYQVDFFQITYLLSNGSLYRAPEHGDGIFYPENTTLAKDEYVEKIEGKTNGEYVNWLLITTNKAQYGPYGTTKLNATQDYAFEGNIVGFYGLIGKYILNSIGVYSLAPVRKTAPYGYFSANFTEHPDALFPPMVRISKLSIRHGSHINAIHAEYQLLGGGERKGAWHGNRWWGKLSVLDFAPDEHIIGFCGSTTTTGSKRLGQISFVTTNKEKKIKIYGPYGTVGGNSFSQNGSVIGYGGSAAHGVVTGIQFYYYDDDHAP